MLNADRDKLRVLAVDKWVELKSSFIREIDKLTARSHRLQFECDDSDDNALHVDRFYGEHPARVLDLQFRPEVPGVLIEIQMLGKFTRDTLTFGLAGSGVSISSQGHGVILPQLMQVILLKITR